MFCVGQTVLYGSNGVCMVDDVTEKRIGKTKIQYYVLKPLCNNTSTLFVPTANQQLVSKMRRILTEDEAEAILRDLPPCGDWNDNKQERSEQFRAITGAACRRKTPAHLGRAVFEGSRKNDLRGVLAGAAYQPRRGARTYFAMIRHAASAACFFLI